MNNFNKEIENAKSICILGHINPDGDCLGSTLGIYNYIKNKYADEKYVKVYLEAPSKKFDWMPGFNEISQSANDACVYDLAIICDCSSLDRVNKDHIRYFNEAKNHFIIDHHETNELNIENIVLDPESPATSQLLYDLLDKKYIDKKVAECLYIGIASDTGVFRYSNTNKKTFEIISELIDKNINFTELLDKTIFMKNFQQKKLEAMIVGRAKFLCKGKVLFAYVTGDELSQYSLEKKDIDFVVGDLRETEGVSIAAFAYETGNDVYKISLRSNGEKINCAEFAKLNNGGGHMRAAGFTMNSNLKNIMTFLDKELDKIINE